MVYLFLAEGFEEIEALTPVDVLRRAGIPIKTVAIGPEKTVLGSRKVPVVADILFGEVEPDGVDMIILPGGQPGADHLYESEELRRIVRFSFEKNRILAAICAAPLVLGRLGLLEGKKATCYPGYEDNLKGAEVFPEKAVVCDGKIVTARGPGAASEFAFKLVELLADKEKADSIRRAMLF